MDASTARVASSATPTSLQPEAAASFALVAIALADGGPVPSRFEPLLPEALRLLAPGGVLVVGCAGAEAQAAASKALLLAGFVQAEEVAGRVTARKPAYAAGASFALRGRANAATAAAAAAAPAAAPGASIWALSADDGTDELVDEDALLSEEDLKRTAPADDCEVGSSGRAPAPLFSGGMSGLRRRAAPQMPPSAAFQRTAPHPPLPPTPTAHVEGKPKPFQPARMLRSACFHSVASSSLALVHSAADA